MRLIDVLAKTRLIPGTSWADVRITDELGGVSYNGLPMGNLMVEVSPKPGDLICIGHTHATRIEGSEDGSGPLTFFTNISECSFRLGPGASPAIGTPPLDHPPHAERPGA